MTVPTTVTEWQINRLECDRFISVPGWVHGYSRPRSEPRFLEWCSESFQRFSAENLEYRFSIDIVWLLNPIYSWNWLSFKRGRRNASRGQYGPVYTSLSWVLGDLKGTEFKQTYRDEAASQSSLKCWSEGHRRASFIASVDISDNEFHLNLPMARKGLWHDSCWSEDKSNGLPFGESRGFPLNFHRHAIIITRWLPPLVAWNKGSKQTPDLNVHGRLLVPWGEYLRNPTYL